MNDTITISKQEFSRLENEVRSVKRLLIDLIEQLAGREDKTQAYEDFATFLKQVHEKLPDVPEEEVEQDILSAVQEVRHGKR